MAIGSGGKRGLWGESRFQNIFDEDDDVVCNKSSQDMMGWDFLVEFPVVHEPDLPYDKRLPNPIARVQVKTQTGSNPSVRLKLTNAMNFTKDALPCYLLLFHNKRRKGVTSILVKEFAEQQMAQTLKAARQNDAGQRLAPHKVILSFDMRDAHCIPEHELVDWFRATCHALPSDYSVTKLRKSEQIGYEEATQQGSFTIKGEHVQRLIDNAVGIGDPVPVERFTLKDVRFGIEAGSAIVTEKPTSVRAIAEKLKATLLIEVDDRKMSFSGEARHMNLPGSPPEMSRIRFHAPGFELIIKGYQHIELSFQIHPKDDHNLRSLANLVYFTHSGGKLAKMELVDRTKRRIANFEVIIPKPDPDNLGGLSIVLDVLSSHELFNANPRVAVKSVLEDFEQLRSVADAYIDGSFDLRFEVFPADLEMPDCKNLLQIGMGRLGQSTFYLISKRPCLGHWKEGEKWRYSFGGPVTLDSGVIQGTSEKCSSAVQKRFERMKAAVGEKVMFINDGLIAKGDTININYVTEALPEASANR